MQLDKKVVCLACDGSGFSTGHADTKLRDAIQKARILLGSLGHGSEDEARLASRIDEILHEAIK